MTPSSTYQAEDDQSSTMMAWRVHEFGPPNVMKFERVLRPNPGPGLYPCQSGSRWRRSLGRLDQGGEKRFAATTPPHSRLRSVW